MRKIVTEAVRAFKSREYISSEKLFEECGEVYGKELFIANKKALKKRIIDNYTSPNVDISEDVMIYYCIPLMNRLDDIQATLAQNLSVVSNFSNVKIILNLFDSDNLSYEWTLNNFQFYIDKGILEVNKLKPLLFWHFSWAKNSFRELIDDHGVYSSLDGDNYLCQEEVARTKQIYTELGSSVIHHFTGSWGDGSSGRVSVPSILYKKYGYSNDIYPRQFDEITLIMNILTQEDGVKFVCRNGVDIFEKSWFLKQFKSKNDWEPKIFSLDLGDTPPPENPKGVGYVKSDLKLELFTKINANYSLLKLSLGKSSKEYFSKCLSEAKRNALKTQVFSQIAKNTVIPCDTRYDLNLSSEPTLYAVIKNDSFFIKSWLNHYRSIGVKRFIIVDDNSEEPLSTLALGGDVFVFKPVIGDFKNFKVYWLMSLMRVYQEEKSVCISVDVDEYLDIPNESFEEGDTTFTKIESLTKNNESLKKYGRIPGILVDLMPKDKLIEVTEHNFLDTMTHHAYVQKNLNAVEEYRKHPSVAWAFSDFWYMSYKYDLRFHVWKTFDSLRKYPLFLYSHDIELNQGFHDLIRDGEKDSLKPYEKVAPIRHYKMLKHFINKNEDVKSDLDGYFGRTQENLNKIFSTDQSDLMYSWSKVEKKRYIPSYSIC